MAKSSPMVAVPSPRTKSSLVLVLSLTILPSTIVQGIPSDIPKLHGRFTTPSLALHEHKTVQPTLHIMLENEDSLLHIPCPLGMCGEDSLCPHAL